MLLISNLRLKLTSEAIEAVSRSPWPQRPPKWSRQHAHGSQGNRGCLFQIQGQNWYLRPLRLSGGCHGLRGHQSGQDNMHMVPRVIEVAYFKSEVKIDIWGHWGCLEVAMASEATKVVVKGNMHIIPKIIEVAFFKSEDNIDIWGHLGSLEVTMVQSSPKELFQSRQPIPWIAVIKHNLILCSFSFLSTQVFRAIALLFRMLLSNQKSW